jgi:hypothetical protein
VKVGKYVPGEAPESVNEGLVPAGFSPPTIDVEIQGLGRLTPMPTASGNGGSYDYNALSNTPKINGVALQGNVTLLQLGVASQVTVVSLDTRVKALEAAGEWG